MDALIGIAILAVCFVISRKLNAKPLHHPRDRRTDAQRFIDAGRMCGPGCCRGHNGGGDKL